MKRMWLIVLAAVAIFSMIQLPAYARYPILQQHYEFNPNISLFTVSGGFMGVDYAYSVKGSFNLNIDYRNQVAWFSDVKAVVTHFPSYEDTRPLPAYPDLFFGKDLDGLINLSSMQGRIVNKYQQIAFTGVDNQGAMMLLGVTLDATPWRAIWPQSQMLRMKGHNDPPCCDFFYMGIDAAARRVPWFYPYMPGDANGDAEVSLVDLDMLGRHYGQAYAVEYEQGDFNGDGVVSLLDLDILGQNFGVSPVSIPEPMTLGLLSLAAASAINRRERSS